MNRRLTRRLGAAAVAAAAALTTAAPAFAHATLQETEPARGATVKVQPKAIVFHFSERVEMNFSAVHIYDATGKSSTTAKPCIRTVSARTSRSV